MCVHRSLLSEAGRAHSRPAFCFSAQQVKNSFWPWHAGAARSGIRAQCGSLAAAKPAILAPGTEEQASPVSETGPSPTVA